MTKEVFELTSLAARYWFVFLLFVIVIRSFLWLGRDNRAWTRKVKSVPSAGNVGEAIVLVGNSQVPQGQIISIPREGDMGSGHGCDIQIKSQLVKKHHLCFRFEENKGLYIQIISNAKVVVDHIELSGKNKKAYILHGSYLVIGDVQLKFLFFAGLGVPYAPNAANEAYMVPNPVAMQAYMQQMHMDNLYTQNMYNQTNYANDTYNEQYVDSEQDDKYYDDEYDEDAENIDGIDNDKEEYIDPDMEDFSHIGGER
ncbi:MAG: FHA domain-containing protein [Christensenellaceae bacterium]|nr:FHA domain-containing protein [Christensenellaceae bacterium]